MSAAGEPPDDDGFGRRGFLRGLGGAAIAAGLGPLAGETDASVGPSGHGERRSFRRRRAAALRYRNKMAALAGRRNRPLVLPEANGEELDHPGYIANYSKGLPHDGLGQVDPAAYATLLRAVESGHPADFEAIPLAGGLKLTSPQAGFAFDLEGPDSHAVVLRPAPRIDGAENSGEMAELYWMALARDVHFSDYAGDATIAQAAADLSRFSDFRGPKAGGAVTPATIFRGITPGDVAGPFLSQFLLLDFSYGSLRVSQQQRTVVGGVDYLTTWGDWLAIQNGGAPAAGDRGDSTRRYVRNLRDLSAYVHADALYEAYLNACLILIGLGAPLAAGIPSRRWQKQIGFVEFGSPHVLTLVTEVATRALKAVWCQKWLVHRRLRPEEFGGRVHAHVTHAASYPIDGELLASAALPAVFAAHGSYLLPQAFPEGCPTHPAYGSGHASVAGACVTVLKAFFDESYVLPAPVVASADGTSVVPWTGGDLTVRDELDKLAANIATGRNAAGIHWRTDYSEAVRLGEAVALGVLQEQKACYNEPPTFSITTFDGDLVTI